jgi:hypothetical protein
VGRDLSSLLCSLVHTLPIECLLCHRWGGGILRGEQAGYKIIIISVEKEEEEEECVHRPQEEKHPLLLLIDPSFDRWMELGWWKLQLPTELKAWVSEFAAYSDTLPSDCSLPSMNTVIEGAPIC